MSLLDSLNKQTGYLVDWKRAGVVMFSTNHRYTSREVLERGFIVARMAVGGFLASNKSEKGGSVPFIFGASLAFLISHTITMSPLIYKRLQASWNCDKIIKQLNEQLKSEQAIAPIVSEVISKIMKHAAVTSASAVWGKRERLLTTLQDWINNNDHDLLNDTLKNENIIELLDKNDNLLSINTSLK